VRSITFAGGLLAAGAIVAVGFASAPSDSAAAASTSIESDTKQVRSRYLSVPQGRAVSAPTTLLQSKLVLRRRGAVFVESDGAYAPIGEGAAASVYVQIDGRRVTNESMIDWRGSTAQVRHSFNAVGARRLSAGTHRIKLVARPVAGAFVVSRSSNLSIFVRPAAQIKVVQRAQRAGPFDFVTSGLGGSGDRLPHRRLEFVAADTRKPTVALASASAQKAGMKGDAMLGIYINGHHPGNSRSLWTVNDLCRCAEVLGPMFTQALLRNDNSRSLISLAATEYPWDQPNTPPAGEDTADYIVRPSSTLVALNGGMNVVGKGEPDRPGFDSLEGTVWDWGCVAMDSDPSGSCPPPGANVRIASGTFEVPSGDPRVVMFTAKSRVQAGANDRGGTIKLWLVIDGVHRGSVGLQDLASPSTISQRTISASYLAAGEQRLTPGKHTIAVYARVEGSFANVSLSRDIPLVWFD
jgi:hypothetical protein